MLKRKTPKNDTALIVVAKPPPTKRALLIGINYFGTESELGGCHNDVDRIHGLLMDQFNFKSENVVVMKDNKHDKRFSNPLSPTRRNILTQMQLITSQMKPDDELFVHYSGHGYYTYDSHFSRDEADNKDELICPVDNTSITDDELHLNLVERVPKSAKVRAIFDCCHSGSMLDLRHRWRFGEKHHNENMSQQCIRKSCAQRNVIMISGCLDTQTSADAFINGDYAGALTWAFCEAVEEADSDGKNHLKTLSWKDLIYNIRFKLHAGDYKYTQIPQISYCQKSQIKWDFDL